MTHDIAEALNEYIRASFAYNAETGVIIRLQAAPNMTHLIGRPSGSIASTGYLVIRAGDVRILAHRLAWFLHYGEWPKMGLDHINRDKLDNRIVNLREATTRENGQNRAPRDLPTSVYRSDKRYGSAIRVNGVRKHLGLFDTPEEAHQAYLTAVKQLE